MTSLFLIAVAFVSAWSESRTFVNIGDNTGVPRSAITRRAIDQGITREQAMSEIRAEIAARKSAE